MSFIPDYLVAGLDQPDFDLRVIPIFQFPDERRCLEWLAKTQEARCVARRLTRSGNTFDVEQRRRIVAGITGLPAPDPKHAKRSVGIDTSHFRVPGFLLVRTVASAPTGSLNNAVGFASESLKLSEATIWRLWRPCRPTAHFAAGLWYKRDLLSCDPRGWLEWVESLRLKGEEYQPLRAPEPVLEPAHTVKMPCSLGLRVVALGLPPAEEITI